MGSRDESVVLGSVFPSKIVEPPRVRVGVAVILVKRHRGDARQILMGMRKGSHGAGTWSFPGGHLEVGETIVQCAARELAEETGIELRHEDFFKVTYTNDIFESEGKHYVTLYMGASFPVSASWEGLEPRVMEPEKCERWEWCTRAPSPVFLPIQNLLKDFDPWVEQL